MAKIFLKSFHSAKVKVYATLVASDAGIEAAA